MNTYKEAGVDEPKEQAILEGMLVHLKETYGNRGEALGQPHFSGDTFANVLNLGDGMGLSITTDGVGTKLLLAQSMQQIEQTAIDLVANNVNDLLCVGAEPIALVDYIGIDTADEDVLLAIAKGLKVGADMAGITIPGGEIAQVAELLHHKHSDTAFDLVATAVGLVSMNIQAKKNLPAIRKPQFIVPGDVLVGIESSGLHSNGYTLARKVFNTDNMLDAHYDILGHTIREELMIPTYIYVEQLLPLLKSELCIKGIANISGGGLLSVPRLNRDVSYMVNRLMSQPKPTIFDMLQLQGGIEDTMMYSTFNMGIGMVLVCSKGSASTVRTAIQSTGRTAAIIGEVIEDERPGRIYIPQHKLIGNGEVFESYE